MGTYIPHTDDEVASMLAFLGLSTRSTSCSPWSPRPSGCSAGLELADGVGEPDVLAHMEALAERNRARSDRLVCFAGGGAYDHEIPSVTRALAGRSEFVTSYTPYQPEVAQGVLQAVFEYQTMVARLAGLPVANASLYDGGSAAVEAVNLGRGRLRARRRSGCRPASIPTGARCWPPAPRGTGHQLRDRRRWSTGSTAWPDDGRTATTRPAWSWWATPTTSAASRTWPRPGPSATGPAPCWWWAPTRWPPGCSSRPGSGGPTWWSGRARSSGPPSGFGGPYLGLFACAAAHVRRLPGRLVGETVDVEGRHGLRHHPAGPGAGHPPGEGHLQRLHQPDPDGGDRGHPARLAGHRRAGRAGPPLRPGHPLHPRRRCSALDRVEPFADAPVVREFAVRLPVPAAVVVERMADAGFLAGIALGRRVRRRRGRAARRGDRAADPGRDRRLRHGAGQGGGVMTGAADGPDRCARGQGHQRPPARPRRRAHPLRALPPGPARLVVPHHRASPRWPSTNWSPRPTAAPSRSPLAEVSERDLVAHFTRLSHRQFSVDLGAYPLGSCTMKYNPKVCDTVAGLPGLAGVHPAAPASLTQGWLALLVELEEALCEITGMAAATLQPAAGAAGELTGLLLMRAWHEAQGSVAAPR